MRIVALVLVLAAAATVGADDARPFTVHDLVAMQRIGDAQPSPDGSRAAFTVTTMDLEANRGRSDVWMVPLAGGEPTQLTTNPAGDFSPRWLDDQTLLFLSSRSGSVQVWRLSLAGGEATQVTDLPVGVESLRIAPTGDALYLGLRVFPDCTSGLACTVERLEAEAARKTTGRVYDRLFVRHWDTWKDGLRAHVFRVDLGDDGRATGEPLDLMPGVDADCPTFPWGGDGDYVISPDGKHLVYTAKLGGSEVAWTTNWDLFAVPTDGSGEPRPITSFNPAWDHSPAFSPDGRTLYWLAMTRPGYESDRNRIVSMPWPKGPVKVLTEDWDRSPGGIAVSPDGADLYVSADNIGNHSIFRVDAETGSVEALLTKHSNRSPQPLADGRLLFARDSLASPVELFVRGAEGGEPAQITDLNGERLAGLQFGDYEQFSFVGAHGDEVFGYLIRPVGFEAGRTYPLAFLVHGGPQGSFDDHWHYRWNPQIYAAHGYATVMIDFHGSTGYGQAFTDSIRGDWGGAPYEDLMMGLDDVLRRHKWIDAQRMAALGASYGGYMINWIQGNTDRFSALVCHDGNLDETMAYFETEELWFPEWERGGTPWENPEGYRKHSPVSTLPNWSTPELVIHGALDFRVVETQGLGTFNALQRLGVPSRLLYFPDENHWVLKPLNSIQWHEVVLDWIDQWTTPSE
jgi:dipeptidyl aminopeptidase/acylaminoacyl peptidase